MKPQRLPLLLALALSAPLATAQTTPPGPPTSATSAMYTLQDLWNRLNAGTAGTLRTGPFTEPSVAPGVKTMHTLNELMALAPAADDANGATAAQVLSGATFWGLHSGGWGPLTGTMPAGSNVSGGNGVLSFAIPDGDYSGKVATAADTNLVAANIKPGVTIFGVTGTTTGAPTIDTPPASQTVTAGQVTTFTVSASGSGLHYVWHKGGVNVGTDSSTLTLALTQTTDAGNYTVTVSNTAGSQISSAAILTVNPLVVNLTPSGNALLLDMKPIPATTTPFTMGQTGVAEPVHQVTISQNFYMGTYLVTQAQWQAATGSNPSNFTGDTTRPVERVSWNDITPFLAWLETNKATICPNCPAGYVFRLPTEAEWEYACRAGTTTSYYWGDDPSGNLIGNYAWYATNSSNTTHSVGGKLPNAWGLCDMSGNVWEWCRDWYDVYPAGGGAQTDPVGATSGSYRVIRGGGWDSYDSCRSAFHPYDIPDDRNGNVGFRVVLAPPRTLY